MMTEDRRFVASNYVRTSVPGDPAFTDHGIQGRRLNVFFVGLITSRLLCALAAWGVLVSAGQAGRIH